MCEYGFIENVDYIVVTQKRVSSEIKGYTEYTDHLMKISMAKEISMIQRNGKGKQARGYFIKCEEALTNSLKSRELKLIDSIEGRNVGTWIH